jgi:hypothetical protein
LMRGLAAWCPVCLTSWEQAGQAVYVPLLWTLEVVKFCPFHRLLSVIRKRSFLSFGRV